ncbi:hypothetical protein [Streptomyces sp. CL7]|uniref:hypothetical protein n=1 Tax=Streptomyces sp. CL7 TaxID=3096006 RepID=UPI002A753992|nr:hypothetical protein [Streptomyces sp. CL7]WPP34288.1 hypothetical protein SJH97_33610 [Streptomyces sp. CL7]
MDGEGDVGFDVMVPCPHDDECDGYAWVPAYSVTCLFRALNGATWTTTRKAGSARAPS